jgi:hypothetical protein
MLRRIFLSVAMIALAAPAPAAIVDLNFRLTARDFVPVAPVDPVTGLYRITFDNAADFESTSTGINVTGLNILGATNMAYVKSVDTLVIGTNVTTLGGNIFNGQDNYVFVVGGASGPSPIPETPGFPAFFSYSQVGFPDRFTSRNVTLELLSGTVPEPSTWAMMIMGFGIVGGAMRNASHKRKSHAPA